MKVNFEMAIEVNNELKLDVPELLKEQCERDDEDGVQESSGKRIGQCG